MESPQPARSGLEVDLMKERRMELLRHLRDWTCERCTSCQQCGQQEREGDENKNEFLKCWNCRFSFHAGCVQRKGSKKAADCGKWVCGNCFKCKSCDRKIDTKTFEMNCELASEESSDISQGKFIFCRECVRKRQRGSFCPICNACYDDNDYETRMMECGSCQRWIHAKCENMSEEDYQILSNLPESVEYICTLCESSGEISTWKEAINLELINGCQAALHIFQKKALTTCRKTKSASLECQDVHMDNEPVSEKSTSANDLMDCSWKENIEPPIAILERTCSPTVVLRDFMKTPKTSEENIYRAALLELESDLLKETCSTERTPTKKNVDMPNKVATPPEQISDQWKSTEGLNGTDSLQNSPTKLVTLFVESCVGLRVPEQQFTSVLDLNIKTIEFLRKAFVDDLSKLEIFEGHFNSALKEVFPWFDAEEIKKSEFSLGKGIAKSTSAANFECESVNMKEIGKSSGLKANSVKYRNQLYKDPFKDVYWDESNRKDIRECLFCHEIGDALPNLSGRLLWAGINEWVHVNCALWSAEVWEGDDGALQQVGGALTRSKTISCNSCGKYGASLNCCYGVCRSTFHFACSLSAGCILLEDKSVFCPKHAKNSKGEIAQHLEVMRQTFVDLEWIRKKEKENLVCSSELTVLIGSLRIDNLGQLLPISVANEVDVTNNALTPLEYNCSRLFWSENVSSEKKLYSVTTHIGRKRSKKYVVKEESIPNFVIDHSLGAHVVQKQLSKLKEFHNWVDSCPVYIDEYKTTWFPSCPFEECFGYLDGNEADVEDNICKEDVEVQTSFSSCSTRGSSLSCSPRPSEFDIFTYLTPDADKQLSSFMDSYSDILSSDVWIASIDLDPDYSKPGIQNHEYDHNILQVDGAFDITSDSDSSDNSNSMSKRAGSSSCASPQSKSPRSKKTGKESPSVRRGRSATTDKGRLLRSREKAPILQKKKDDHKCPRCKKSFQTSASVSRHITWCKTKPKIKVQMQEESAQSSEIITKNRRGRPPKKTSEESRIKEEIPTSSENAKQQMMARTARKQAILTSQPDYDSESSSDKSSQHELTSKASTEIIDEPESTSIEVMQSQSLPLRLSCPKCHNIYRTEESLKKHLGTCTALSSSDEGVTDEDQANDRSSAPEELVTNISSAREVVDVLDPTNSDEGENIDSNLPASVESSSPDSSCSPDLDVKIASTTIEEPSSQFSNEIEICNALEHDLNLSQEEQSVIDTNIATDKATGQFSEASASIETSYTIEAHASEELETVEAELINQPQINVLSVNFEMNQTPLTPLPNNTMFIPDQLTSMQLSGNPITEISVGTNSYVASPYGEQSPPKCFEPVQAFDSAKETDTQGLSWGTNCSQGGMITSPSKLNFQNIQIASSNTGSGYDMINRQQVEGYQAPINPHQIGEIQPPIYPRQVGVVQAPIDPHKVEAMQVPSIIPQQEQPREANTNSICPDYQAQLQWQQNTSVPEVYNDLSVVSASAHISRQQNVYSPQMQFQNILVRNSQGELLPLRLPLNTSQGLQQVAQSSFIQGQGTIQGTPQDFQRWQQQNQQQPHQLPISSMPTNINSPQGQHYGMRFASTAPNLPREYFSNNSAQFPVNVLNQFLPQHFNYQPQESQLPPHPCYSLGNQKQTSCEIRYVVVQPNQPVPIQIRHNSELMPSEEREGSHPQACHPSHQYMGLGGQHQHHSHLGEGLPAQPSQPLSCSISHQPDYIPSITCPVQVGSSTAFDSRGGPNNTRVIDCTREKCHCLGCQQQHGHHSKPREMKIYSADVKQPLPQHLSAMEGLYRQAANLQRPNSKTIRNHIPQCSSLQGKRKQRVMMHRPKQMPPALPKLLPATVSLPTIPSHTFLSQSPRASSASIASLVSSNSNPITSSKISVPGKNVSSTPNIAVVRPMENPLMSIQKMSDQIDQIGRVSIPPPALPVIQSSSISQFGHNLPNATTPNDQVNKNPELQLSNTSVQLVDSSVVVSKSESIATAAAIALANAVSANIPARKPSTQNISVKPDTLKNAEAKSESVAPTPIKITLKRREGAGTYSINSFSAPGAGVPNSGTMRSLKIKAKITSGEQAGTSSLVEVVPVVHTVPIPNESEENPTVCEDEKVSQVSTDEAAQLLHQQERKAKLDRLTHKAVVVYKVKANGVEVFQSSDVHAIWNQIFEIAQGTRMNQNLPPLAYPATNIALQDNKLKGKPNFNQLGLQHRAVQFLLEQLPGAKNDTQTKHDVKSPADLPTPSEDLSLPENKSGSARAEGYKGRKPFDMFGWLASKERKPLSVPIQMKSSEVTRIADLPMAMKFRNLRKVGTKHLQVYWSVIHGRGLFTVKDIEPGEMIIEYAGELIRSSLCDSREKHYESKGIGCYMFRIDDDQYVVDATMKGNAARFINHCCEPNCYSKITEIFGKKRILIFALRKIQFGEELTYDYKFPYEEVKIPCSCGTSKCRKYLN